MMIKDNLKLFILSILLIVTGFTYGQEKKLDADFVVGASVPELYHLGIRLHYMPNGRIDLNFGSDFNNDENGILYSATINHAIYFGKVNPRTDTKLWSFNSGLSFLVEQTILLKSTASYLNLFFARELRITKKLYIQPELGASYFLFDHIVNQENEVVIKQRTRIIPKFGLNMIVKLGK